MMHFRLLLRLSTVLSAALTAASSLTITIPVSSYLPNPNALSASTHAALTSLSLGPSQRTARLTRSSTFVFRNLDILGTEKAESFLLDIHSAEFIFAPLRVDVASNGTVIGVWETHRGHSWDNRGVQKFVATPSDSTAESHNGRDVIVEARLAGRKEFYEQRTKFSPLVFLKNPMVLLALVALLFTFGMPKVLENMDPETRAELQTRSRTSPMAGATRGAGGGMPNFDLAGWMAGTAPSPLASLEAAAEATGRDAEGVTRRK